MTRLTWKDFSQKEVKNITYNNKKIDWITRDSDKEVVYIDENILWKPSLNGKTGAKYAWSYSESNGECVGKGFVLNGGWTNEDYWKCTYQFKHDNIRYTGLAYLINANSTYNGKGASDSLITWEGSFPGDTAYASYTSGAVGYFDITVQKFDNTHIIVKSETLGKNGFIEFASLPNWTQLSIGARHNNTSSSYGPCRMKDVIVRKSNAPVIVFTSNNQPKSNYILILRASIDGEPVINAPVTFKNETSNTVLGTVNTDSNGEASLNVSSMLDYTEDKILSATIGEYTITKDYRYINQIGYRKSISVFQYDNKNVYAVYTSTFRPSTWSSNQQMYAYYWDGSRWRTVDNAKLSRNYLKVTKTYTDLEEATTELSTYKHIIQVSPLEDTFSYFTGVYYGTPMRPATYHSTVGMTPIEI